MSVMYFVPDAESIKAAKESNCPLATPRDPAPCKGERCMSWNHKENKPCDGFRGERSAA